MSTARDFIEAEREHRLAKLEALRRRGIIPYPVGFARDHSVGDARGRFAALAPDTVTDTVVRIAGRLMLIRRHGGVVFADLKDQTGTIQLLASREVLGAEALADVVRLDRGDWVGAVGTVMSTRTGELTVRVSELQLLSKSLRALPDKRRGLTDVDTRLRERYVDLIVNPASRRIFDIRSAVVGSVRSTLIGRGFVEVETPVLDAQAGGAAARPFITHHNALDIDMYLRIALELPLKRLVVGGFERVFEIGRVFRNEGLDTRHNPEFTLLEAYQALTDYHDMMDLVETIASQAALAATGSTLIELDGRTVDLKPPWRRVTMADLIEERTGARMHPSMPIADARAICDRTGVEYESGWGSGRLMSEVYDETAEATLVEPTFVYDYPREVSPLARTHRDDPSLVERFEAVVGGRELANAYSELNDPVDQRGRFEAEAAAKAAGDEEAESLDEDYIRALEYGLPPTGGLGIGIDRLVMLIAGAPSIREVILFPTMRPEAGTAPRAARRPLHSSGVPTAAAMASHAATAPASPPADATATVPASPPPDATPTAPASPPADATISGAPAPAQGGGAPINPERGRRRRVARLAAPHRAAARMADRARRRHLPAGVVAGCPRAAGNPRVPPPPDRPGDASGRLGDPRRRARARRAPAWPLQAAGVVRRRRVLRDRGHRPRSERPPSDRGALLGRDARGAHLAPRCIHRPARSGLAARCRAVRPALPRAGARVRRYHARSRERSRPRTAHSRRCARDGRARARGNQRSLSLHRPLVRRLLPRSAARARDRRSDYPVRARVPGRARAPRAVRGGP
jgi:lysyl-tRNA synthetase